MRILIANDDGIYSPGIATLARVASRFGDVRVVAPDIEQSSAGHAITSSKPLTYRRTKVIDGIESYRVNGTPADCVALGAHNWDKVDIVLSGINLGPNLGNAIWHSGTLAAAKQAALLGFRGIALSTPVVGDDPDVSYLEPHVERVLELLLPDESLRLVNVNFPPADRDPLDPPGRRAVRRQGDPRYRPAPADLLVHRLPARGARRGHRPVGHPAGLRVDHAARAGPHRPPEAGGRDGTRPRPHRRQAGGEVR